jgi:aspartyl-tRNA(Asn)/glutamyl-tRNA(Gln) amidotransferase subunit C
MAQLSLKDVKHVATLANLPLTDSDIDTLTPQLSSIISYIDELSQVDTTGVTPTSQTTGLDTVLRDDEVQPDRTLSVEEALHGTENTLNGYIVVPMVLEEKKDE